jgi:hypothetical protein
MNNSTERAFSGVFSARVGRRVRKGKPASGYHILTHATGLTHPTSNTWD